MAGKRIQVLRQKLAAWLPALVLLMATGPAPATEQTIQQSAGIGSAAADVDDDGNARVIVKYRRGSSLAQSRRGAQRLGQQLQLTLQDGHVLGQRSQSLRARGLGAQALATRLAAEPDVEWAQPVGRKTVQAVLPNDSFFAAGQASPMPAVGQWYLRAPDTTLVSAVNAVGAWAMTTGSASITVAVLDTGVLYDHPDLLPASQPGGKLWPGYDFVSLTASSNDGGGADNDANDPGDWGGACSTSSWHGTQVAGLIGAATDNGIGIAGVGRNTMLLPVRVLGRCGSGFDDDIIAGMRWAGGLANAAGCTSTSSASATCNPHPARVINLSLGSSGACSDPYREAIADLNVAGVVVVVAAGNDTGRLVDEPANCPGALAVVDVRHLGTKGSFSNLGPQVAIAAPGGNCGNAGAACLYPLVTTRNAGTTSPGASTYSDSVNHSEGTSFATPIVAGSVALMLAVNPALTPAAVKTALQVTARTFPVSGAETSGTVACRAPDLLDQMECYCTTSTCGAGLLDAGAAVQRALALVPAPTAVITASTSTPTAGDPVSLNAAGSIAASGRSLAYQWVLTSGSGVASFIGATDGSSASLATTAAGTVVVQLTVTDSAGGGSSASQTITVAALPVVVTPPVTPSASPGGGGAMGAGWLLALAAAVLLLWRAAPRSFSGKR